MEARYQKNRKAASVAVPEKTIKLSTRGGKRTEMDRLGGASGSREGFCSFSSVALGAIERCYLSGW